MRGVVEGKGAADAGTGGVGLRNVRGDIHANTVEEWKRQGPHASRHLSCRNMGMAESFFRRWEKKR